MAVIVAVTACDEEPRNVLKRKAYMYRTEFYRGQGRHTNDNRTFDGRTQGLLYS